MNHGSDLAPMLVRLVLALGLVWHGAGDLLERVEPSPDDRPAAMALGLLAAPAESPPGTGASPLASGQILATNTGGAVAADPSSTGTGRPDAGRMARMHQRTLAVHHAATNPGPSGAGPGPEAEAGPTTVLPAMLSSGRWPAIIAWLSVVLQFAAAAGLLVGLLTRLAAGVVLAGLTVHLWVVSIGPAALHGASLLPAGGLFTAEAAAVVLLPLGAITLCVALLAAGSGAAGIDHIMAGETDEYDTDE